MSDDPRESLEVTLRRGAAPAPILRNVSRLRSQPHSITGATCANSDGRISGVPDSVPLCLVRDCKEQRYRHFASRNISHHDGRFVAFQARARFDTFTVRQAMRRAMVKSVATP